MKIVTTRMQIRDAADRFRLLVNLENGTYPNTSYWKKRDRDRYERLQALDSETATAADVERIVGTKGWVGPACDECGREMPGVASFVQEEECGCGALSLAHWICADCLRKAADAIDEALAAASSAGSEAS